MSKRETIARYHLIIKKVRKNPATFEQILDYLDLESELQEYDFRVSKRTFQRDLNDIRSLYNIDIEYDRKGKVYRINFDDSSDSSERILEAFDTFNALNISDRLSENIHFESRRPQGTENLYGLLHSIQNELIIRFEYHKYWDDEISDRETEAYALKEFKNRWYLLAKDLKDNKIKSFALDRLSNLDITKKKFVYPANFNVNEYYKYSFGIINSDEPKPKEIILSFDAHQGKYIKSLPLHKSQEILIDNDDEVRIKLQLFITDDFIMELLSHSNSLTVIKPQILIDEIKKRLHNTLKNYN